MQPIKVCLNCGSTELVSDRSLGGRMVCYKCGSSSFRNKTLSPLKIKKIYYLLAGLLILVIIVI